MFAPAVHPPARVTGAPNLEKVIAQAEAWGSIFRPIR